MALKPVSVSQLNGYIKRILATDPILMNVSVAGEISNLVKHSSGHWYFSLKDENSSIRCFLPKDRVYMLRMEIEEGMKVCCFGNVSVYEKNGSYSLNIKTMEALGEGDLKKAFDLLFKKLSEEGLFNSDRKKTLPAFPKRIGIVTSPTGAAVRDIITTAKRRNPLVNLVLYPCLVQGDGSAVTVANGIEAFNNRFTDIDIIIAGRGGGSAEDLWTFNEEIVARAIADSRIPVISAVGHERDYLISDFAADVRAATPTAAAELAIPDIEYYIDKINSASPLRLYENLIRRLDDAEIKTEHLYENIRFYTDRFFSDKMHTLQLLKLDIDSYNPALQIEKGYAVVKKTTGEWISDISGVSINDMITVTVKDGDILCIVDGVENKYD